MSKTKMSTIRVAVCGLTSSSYNGSSGEGAGKSCLCNRLIQSTHDQLHTDHTSVLNLSEFGSNVINNTHFLYWGEKVTVLEDGQELKFQIVEHTEFVDDSSLKAFSTTKPYHKRCIVVKLQSGGKVTYLEPNQLALPEHFTEVPKFPDKFSVDGFIVCVDVSTHFDHPSDPQKEFFDRLLLNLLSTKKPVVVACTKFDRCKASSVASVAEIIARSKKQVPIVEVSALKGVNVDTCFLVLAHMVDVKKPKTKIVSYAESKALLDERVRRNEEAFQTVLDEQLDFSVSLEQASSRLRPVVEHQVLVDLCGKERVKKLIQAKLNYLKLLMVKAKSSQFVKMLPHIFVAMLPTLELEATPQSAVAALRSSPKFGRYFVDVENWKENMEFLRTSLEDAVPFEILHEEQALEMLVNHINEVLAEVRARAAAEKIRHTLLSTPGILPGVDMVMLWVDLGLSAEVKRIGSEEQVLIYNEYMGKLEQECVADLTELFLEQSDMFDQISSSPNDAFDRVHQELKEVARYKRLDHRSQLRMSQALKHIGSLQMPEKSPAYGRSGLQVAIETLKQTGVLSRETLWPAFREEGAGPYWEMDPNSSCFRLCILGRTEDNTKILRSDFMNHFSGSGEVEVDDKTYRMEMALQYGHHIHSLNTNNFVPHGAVAVVTSLECIDWLKDLVERLWLFEVGGGAESRQAPYRGMPLIILALDKDAAPLEAPSRPPSIIHSRAQALAGEVQCVFIAETPTPQPMRLVITSVIHQIFLSLVNAFSHLDSFLNSDLQPMDRSGFNIAVCTLVGDPYPNEALLNPLLKHQLVCCNESDHTLFLKCALEKQHRTCVFSFNSMFSVPELCSSIHLGFIFVYSAQRAASLAVLKCLLPKLPNIPKLIVAMTTPQLRDRSLVEEGQEVAGKWKAMFVTNAGEELTAGFAIEFLQKCWFRRFSSWKSQNFTDSARLQLRGKQARALPNRPTFQSHQGPPTIPQNRHSMGSILLDHVEHADHTDQFSTEISLTSSGTLPRSPIKPFFKDKFSSFEDGDIYSDPVTQKIGKKATLDRRKKSSLPLSPPFLSPPHVASPVNDPGGRSDQLSDYASVEDALQLSELHAGMVDSLRRQPRRSPSMSPPPPPLSPPMHIPLEEVGEEEGAEPMDLYATVDTSHRKVKSPTGKGYDHLHPDDSPPMKGYDHLINPSPPAPSRPPRTDLAPKSKGAPSSNYAPLSVVTGGGADAPPSDVYDTLDEREGPTYATIDVCKKAKKVLPPSEPPTNRSPSPAPALRPRNTPRPPSSRSVDDSTAVNRTAAFGGHQRIKSDDLHLHSDAVAPTSTEQMYSTVQKKPRPPSSRSVDDSTAVNRTAAFGGHQRIKSDDLHLHSDAVAPTSIEQMYSTVQKKPRPHSKPRSPPTQEAPVYSVPTKKRPPVLAPKPSSRSPTPSTESRREGPVDEPMYSIPDKTRKRPPPLAPKPSSRSPTPSGERRRVLKVPAARAAGITHMRSESFDTALRPDLKSVRSSHSSSKQQQLQRSPLADERSPSPEIKTFSSLPSSYRNRAWMREADMHRARSREELSHYRIRDCSPPPRMTHGRSMEDQSYGLEQANNEVEWEEDAPPLPSRKYSWSDIEDNDEDILQSDDDLDESNETIADLSTMEQQKLYSTIRRLSMHTPNSIEAIYNVVNRIHIPNRETTPPDASSSQWLPHAEQEEQVYDTLENIVSGMELSVAPSSATPWPEETGRGEATGMESIPLTARDIKLIKQQQKLMKKLQKKVEREAEQRRKMGESKRRREDELHRREKRKKGKKGKYNYKPAVNERSRYFGSPLAKVVESDGVPVFVHKCVQFIETNGIQMVGLYRVSGKKDDCLALQEKYDQDSTLDIGSLDYYTSCISSTLKAFFKLLPEPLVSNEIASQLLVINSLDVDSQRTRINEILSGMSRPNLHTFHCLMLHLHQVQCHQDTNKMNASNLAIVFWPTLIRPPLMDLADPGKQLGWQLVMTRIIEHPDLVPVEE